MRIVLTEMFGQSNRTTQMAINSARDFKGGLSFLNLCDRYVIVMLYLDVNCVKACKDL